jgi:predicted CoA-substrate-specific enzyme activase
MDKIGIDLGSRFVKIAVLKNEEMEFVRFDTVEFYKNHIKKEGNTIHIKTENLPIKNSRNIVATGYGRNLMNFANAKIVSEIKAHYKGAIVQTGLENFTLIDIGGQDSKVISVRDGYIDDFVMNDKCAASTGRFIENTCNILNIDMEYFAKCIDSPEKMNSTCAIFSESEIIGKIAEGCSIESIAAGVSESIARRICPLIKKFKNKMVIASGGVADVYAIRYFISKILGIEVVKLDNSQFNGAIGCIQYCG